MARIEVNFAWSDFIDSKLYVLSSVKEDGTGEWTKFDAERVQLMEDDVVVDDSRDGNAYVGVVLDDGNVSWDSKHRSLSTAYDQAVRMSKGVA